MAERLRQLLVADLALVRGVVTAQDVGAALIRSWEEDDAGAFLRELRRVAKLPEDGLAAFESEADQLIEAAGDQVQAAVTRRGGFDRTIFLALEEKGPEASRALTHLGAKVRAPLRTLPDDRYVAFEVAGEGGMGLVYAALDTELNRRVAFKMVKPAAAEPTDDQDAPTTPIEATPPEGIDTPASAAFEELKARFLQEAWGTGGMEHPSIVPVYELGRTGRGIPYYTMRFVRGRRTFHDAIHELEAEPFESRLALLEPFLKLCDAVSYAHSKGVVHRDLKPENVALGEFGEVVLLDWGLAKIEGREDLTGSLWKQKIHKFREAADLQTLEGAFGTPGFMAPEAALGEIDRVGPRSDVYSLGAILFLILTGRLPVPVTNVYDYVKTLTSQKAPAATTIDPSVPSELSDLCARCLASDEEERTESVASLAGSLRAWQAQSAIDREVEGHVRDVRAALGAAEDLSGAARLRQVDRAAAALALVVERKPDDPRAGRHREQIAALREEGMRERETAMGRRLLVRVGVAALVLATVAGFLVAATLEGRRREAESERAKTAVALGEKTAALEREQRALEAEKKAKAKAEDALASVLRLDAAKRVRELVAEADMLWPLLPRVEAMEDWLRRARGVAKDRAAHEQALADLRARALPYTEEQRQADHANRLEDVAYLEKELQEAERRRQSVLDGEPNPMQLLLWTRGVAELRDVIEQYQAETKERASWQFASAEDTALHEVLAPLVAGLEQLLPSENSNAGTVAAITARHALASSLHERSIVERKELWDETITAVSKLPKYGGLTIRPQVGLIPLGPDPSSGLFEFAHVGSGSIPTREEASRRLVQSEDAALVFVLIPGGIFSMGAQKEDAGKPNHDAQALPDESPVREVTLTPYFLSKYECTQAQWTALTEGLEPSLFEPGETYAKREIGRRNPVERVSWADAYTWLWRIGLVLPTEAQWECACRAGSATPWFTGRDAAALGKVANISDAWFKAHEGKAYPVTPGVDDGHSLHAPVGSFLPNAFGLHDLHGNVYEWCRDGYGQYVGSAVTDPKASGPSVIFRGGSFATAAGEVRSSRRNHAPNTFRDCAIGVRPARAIDP